MFCGGWALILMDERGVAVKCCSEVEEEGRVWNMNSIFCQLHKKISNFMSDEKYSFRFKGPLFTRLWKSTEKCSEFNTCFCRNIFPRVRQRSPHTAILAVMWNFNCPSNDAPTNTAIIIHNCIATWLCTTYEGKIIFKYPQKKRRHGLSKC